MIDIDRLIDRAVRAAADPDDVTVLAHPFTDLPHVVWSIPNFYDRYDPEREGPLDIDDHRLWNRAGVMDGPFITELLLGQRWRRTLTVGPPRRGPP